MDAAIKRQIEEHGLSELNCDYSRVNWSNTVAKAVAGKPPFSSATDKGFKDAVVLESLCQLVDGLPASARVLLLSNDGILGEAAKERLKPHPNAKVMSDIGELKTLINALASHIDQSAVDEILVRASELFFQPKKLSTLYYKFKIIDAIAGDAQFQKPLEAGYNPTTKDIFIGKTSFIAKAGQQITFSNDIRITLEARKLAPPRFRGLLGLGGLGSDLKPRSSLLRLKLAELGDANVNQSGAGLNLRFPQSELANIELPDLVLNGQQIFGVQWQATLGANGRLSKSKLLAVKFAPAEWFQS